MIVYLSEHIHPVAERKLRTQATVVDNFDEIEKIDAIILRNIDITREMLEKAVNLKVIAKHGVGLNTIDIDAAKELGIMVIYTPTSNVNTVAELIVGLILNLYRNIYVANKYSRKGIYKQVAPTELTGLEIRGKTLGLIGIGRIAQTTAKILKRGFDVDVVAYDPYVSKEEVSEMGYKKYNEIKELIKVSDIINVSVPLTEKTKNLVAGDVFDYFKADAILINAARGGIVNEDDLYKALINKKIRAAACDAFVVEPPTPENSKLLSLDNVSVTPHIGGNTEEALYRAGTELVEEVFRILAGEKPIHPAY